MDAGIEVHRRAGGFASSHFDILLRLLIAAGLAVLGGCAVATFNHASNLAAAPDAPGETFQPRDIAGSNAIALSFSGGGMRAAAFAHGALLALAQTSTDEGDLLDDVSFISSVSGGSLTAAYYGIHGREGLARFRDDVLTRDLESSMRVLPFLPSNFMRILGGGLNDNFAAALDTGVFHGATFADMSRRPKPAVWIQATDLYNRVAFVFTPLTFSLICSDLARYSVAEAVAASMAVPLVFAPVVLRTYPQACRSPLPASLLRLRYDPDAPMLERAAEAAVRSYREQPAAHFIKLGDGGLSDNLGVSTLLLARAVYGSPHAPFSDADAVRIRRLLFIVVDASRPPGGDWTLRERGPEGVDLALAGADAAIDSAARLAADAFGSTIRAWQDAVTAFRCSLSSERASHLGARPGWNCRDVKFTLAFVSPDRLDDGQLRAAIEATPTRLALPRDAIDRAVQGGRDATLASPLLHQYLRERISRGH
jgi:NTE family protein